MAASPSNMRACTLQRFNTFTIAPSLVLAITLIFVYGDTRSSPALVATSFGIWLSFHVASLTILAHRHACERIDVDCDADWFKRLRYTHAQNQRYVCILPAPLFSCSATVYIGSLAYLGTHALYLRSPIETRYHSPPWTAFIPITASVLVSLSLVYSSIRTLTTFDSTDPSSCKHTQNATHAAGSFSIPCDWTDTKA